MEKDLQNAVPIYLNIMQDIVRVGELGMKRTWIFPAAIIGAMACLMAVSAGAAANPGPYPYPTHIFSWKAGVILDVFMVNLIFNAIIFIVPLAILTQLNYDKELSSTWAWTIPFITIVGAYADFWAFEIDAISRSTAIILIGVSYFFSVVLVLGYKITTGFIMAAWAMAVNYLVWKYSASEFDEFTTRILWTVGLVLLAIMIAVFAYNTLRVLARRAEPKRKDYLRQAFCTIATLLLLFFPFLYYRL